MVSTAAYNSHPTRTKAHPPRLNRCAIYRLRASGLADRFWCITQTITLPRWSFKRGRRKAEKRLNLWSTQTEQEQLYRPFVLVHCTDDSAFIRQIGYSFAILGPRLDIVSEFTTDGVFSSKAGHGKRSTDGREEGLCLPRSWSLARGTTLISANPSL